MISILVLSPAYRIREMLARYLPHEEFAVYTTDSVEVALHTFETILLNAVILDLQHPSALDLLDWLQNAYPLTHPVIICNQEDADLKELLRTRKASFMAKNKLNLLELRNTLKTMCPHKRGLTYQFSQINLFELVKLVSFSGHSTQLYLTSPQTRQEGLIHFGQGKVQNAMYGELEDEAAFYEIMKMKRGLFSEMQALESDDIVIASSLDQLMANSALMIDEKNGMAQIPLPPTHCLILSEDPHIPTFLGELFRFNKESVLVVDWARHEAEAQQQLLQNPELLILDLDTSPWKARKVLEFIDHQYLDTRIILLGKDFHPSLNQLLLHPCVVRFLVKPQQYQELAEMIEQNYLAQHFSGELLDLSLFGVLQIFSYFRHNRLLEVMDFFSGQAGQVFLSDGEIQHATFGDLVGRDALKKILHINYGLFRQETYWEPVTKSLNTSFNRLMMYLSRFIDDSSPQQSAKELLLQSGELISIRSDKIEALREIQHPMRSFLKA